jgi:2-polyprenyl-3-methyl-5-hydroxy-6-metoxy-1,4-benzoquinol methylase
MSIMPAVNDAPRPVPELADWPAEDLQSAPRCEVCAGARRACWLDRLEDRIFHAAPGRWTLWRCLDCGAATLDPRPSAASIARAYRSYYTHAGVERNFLVPGDRPDLKVKRAVHLSYYNRCFGYRFADALPLGWLAIAASDWRSARAGQFIRHLPAPHEGARLLDVGCGDGGFLRVARTLGYSAQGIEFDPAAAALAERQGFAVHVGGLAETQLPAGAFDQITLSHVIEHLHDPVAALARLCGWLKPGGRIWLQTPNVESAGAQRYGADWRGLEPPRHVVLFGPGSLRQALERSGFAAMALMPPQLDAAFYIGQSEAIRAGRDPYRPDRAERRAARREGGAWDRAALADPARAESITMIAFRPA